MTETIEVPKAAREHTSGPWSLPHFAKPDVNCNCEYVLCDEHMGAIASVHCSGDGNDWEKNGDNPRFEEAVGNAHLIAAAPDLLEALKYARRFCRKDAIDVAFIDAAIAKAEGRA